MLKAFHSFLKREGRLAAAVWGPLETVQFALPIPVIFEELELPPPPPGQPGPFALADAHALARLVVSDAGFRDVETGAAKAIYETASPEDFTQWTRDVAPPIVNLVKGQPPEMQERVWRKVTEAWAPLVTPGGGSGPRTRRYGLRPRSRGVDPPRGIHVPVDVVHSLPHRSR